MVTVIAIVKILFFLAVIATFWRFLQFVFVIAMVALGAVIYAINRLWRWVSRADQKRAAIRARLGPPPTGDPDALADWVRRGGR